MGARRPGGAAARGKDRLMDDISARVLAQLEPDHLDDEGLSWQQRKSVQTRLAILEAAIDCLNQHGYARTTTLLISQIAGVSRGAMLHHYATKQELIAAVSEYIAYKRMQVFLDGIHALSDEERVDGMVGIEVYWKGLQGREFNAYLELMMAARTDPELAADFLPRARQYNRLELAEVISVFPEWQDDPDGYALAMDFCSATLQGLLLNVDVWSDEDQRARLRRLVADLIGMILTRRLDPSGRMGSA
jgi:AcrR family transcriptional regulator